MTSPQSTSAPAERCSAATVDAVAAAIMTVFIKKWFLGSYKGPVYLDCVNGEKAWQEEAKAAMAVIPAVAQGWQDISAAPTSGDKILLWWKYCKTASVGFWDHDELWEKRSWGHKAVKDGWRCEGDACIPVNQSDCTHWQPLPLGPSVPSTHECTCDTSIDGELGLDTDEHETSCPLYEPLSAEGK